MLHECLLSKYNETQSKVTGLKQVLSKCLLFLHLKVSKIKGERERENTQESQIKGMHAIS